MSKKGLGKLVLGAGIGASLALLFAPKKGSDLRNEIKKGLDELDKETVLKAAKKKGNELKDKANELVELAKEKGTPVLEGIADDLKEKTISVAQEVIDKLEEK